MTTTTEVRKRGARTTGAGLLIATIGALLLIAAVVGGGGVSALSILLIAVGILIAGAGFARRVLAALEGR